MSRIRTVNPPCNLNSGEMNTKMKAEKNSQKDLLQIEKYNMPCI